MTIATSFRQCGACHTRLLILAHTPPLNYWPDPAGQVAVSIASPRIARFLGRGEEPGGLEKRHAVHECGAVAEPEFALQRHADHAPGVCRPAGNGLCEPLTPSQQRPAWLPDATP